MYFILNIQSSEMWNKCPGILINIYLSFPTSGKYIHMHYVEYIYIATYTVGTTHEANETNF